MDPAHQRCCPHERHHLQPSHHGLRLAEIEVDRKILAELAVNDFEAFSALCEAAKAALPEDVNAPKAA